MPVTSRDVARLARVSQATVSRALAGSSLVTAETRQKVEAAATTLGYVRSEVGRSLRTQATRQVGMVADLENQLYPALMPALHDRLYDAGYRLIMLAERPEHAEISRRLLDRSVDGVILTTTFLSSPLPAKLARSRVPFVYLNRVHASVPADSVVVDNLAGGAAVARLMVGLGHRRVGAIFSSPKTSTGRDRERGFRAVLEESGIELPPSRVFYGWFAYAYGEQGLAALLDSAAPPTAVFCANDLVAIGALAEAARRGVRVPDDLTVVGFDDLEMASWPWLELTTVASPLTEMADTAARLLLDRMAGNTEPPRVRQWPAELVLRRTHAGPTVRTGGAGALATS